VKIIDLGLLILLGAIWGASFLFIRIASPVVGPIVLMDLRVLIASFALFAYCCFIGQRKTFLAAWKTRWKSYLVLGLLNAAIPFTLIAVAALNVTASILAILNSTTPLFGAVIAAVWLKDRFTLRRGIGLAIGFSGVLVLVGWSPIPLDLVKILSMLAMLTAAFAFALGGVYSQVAFKGYPPVIMSIGQQFAAGLILFPLNFAFLPGAFPDFRAILAILGLALLSTAIAYLIYFRLMNRVGPAKTLTVTFLLPGFGILWGVLFLNEPLNATMFIGLGIILISILIVTEVKFRKT
jgi:drug/metabolite transporter (DMT)-like permease